MSDKQELNKLNEFELLDKLSSMLGVATKESKEESWNDVITHRKILRKAIIELDKAWNTRHNEFNDKTRCVKLSKDGVADWCMGDAAIDSLAEHLKLIKELKEVVQAVANIGVDFGYGNYELQPEIIDKARAILDS